MDNSVKQNLLEEKRKQLQELQEFSARHKIEREKLKEESERNLKKMNQTFEEWDKAEEEERRQEEEAEGEYQKQKKLDDEQEKNVARSKGFLCIGGDAIFGGVCAGFAKSFKYQPWKVRVAFLLLAKIAIFVYVLCWLFIPKED